MGSPAEVLKKEGDILRATFKYHNDQSLIYAISLTCKVQLMFLLVYCKINRVFTSHDKLILDIYIPLRVYPLYTIILE